MPSTVNLLTQTVDRFDKALAIAHRQYPPPCLTEVGSRKEKGESLDDPNFLFPTSYFLLPCSACPLALSPETCPHRYQLKKALAEAIALN